MQLIDMKIQKGQWKITKKKIVYNIIMVTVVERYGRQLTTSLYKCVRLSPIFS